MLKSTSLRNVHKLPSWTACAQMCKQMTAFFLDITFEFICRLYFVLPLQLNFFNMCQKEEEGIVRVLSKFKMSM